MTKCMACPGEVSDPKKSLKRIADILRLRTVLRGKSPEEAAQDIGPLCDQCQPRWEATVPPK